MSISLYLGVLIFSFIIASVLIIPAIDFLYHVRFLRKESGTPSGGGVLLVLLTTILFLILFPISARLGIYITSYFSLKQELNVLFVTFVSFGLLGLYDDLHQVFKIKKSPIPQIIFELVLAALCSLLLYANLHISIINLPGFGVIHLHWWYLFFATFYIFVFTRGAQAIKDINGLSSGVLLIALISLWTLSFGRLDTPLSMFIAILIGCLVAFQYFNVYPARILLGSAGSLAISSILAVIGLILGKSVAVIVVGLVLVVSGLTTLFRPSWSPAILLQKIGWPEPKIAFRFWIVAILLSIFGLWLSTF